jgi:hypothetical protein
MFCVYVDPVSASGLQATWSEVVSHGLTLTLDGWLAFAREAEVYPRMLSRTTLEQV